MTRIRVMFGLMVTVVLAACASATATVEVPTEGEAVATAAEESPAPTRTPAPVGDTATTDCETPFLVDRLRGVWQLTDFCQFEAGVFEEILSGGVPRDGIPPIDDPTYESIAAASAWLAPQSPVIVIELGEAVRAYPLAILTRHEIVNTELGGRPLAVTFCPLCNSAVVFDREVDGQVYRFGVSGLLRNSDLIMWDDVTESWWQQFTGRGIVGTHTGDQLTIYPSVVAGFGQFVDAFPDGEVLAPPALREYGRNPYAGYDSNPQPFLFPEVPDERLPATSRVLAGVIDGEAVAYPYATLQALGVVNDTVGDAAVVAFWQAGQASALDDVVIDTSEDVGTAAMYGRVVAGQTLTFEVAGDGSLRDVETGSTWNVFGQAVAGELAGAQLEPLRVFPHFWFAWAAFQPETVIYGE